MRNTDIPDDVLITVYIKGKEQIDANIVFIGYNYHWQNCFFDNAYREIIKDYVESEGWTVIFSDE